MRNISAIEFGPDADSVFLGDSTGHVALMTWRDNAPLWRLPLHTQWVRDIVSARSLAQTFSCGEDGRVCKFDRNGNAAVLSELGGICWSLSLSGDDQHLAVATDDGSVYLLPTTGQAAPVAHRLGRAPIRAVTWHSGLNSFIAAGDDGVLFAIDSNRAAPRTLAELDCAVRSLCTLASGAILAGSQNGSIVTLASNGALLSRVEAHAAEVRTIVRDGPNGFVSAGRDGRIAFWVANAEVPKRVMDGLDGGIRCARSRGDLLGVCSENRAFVFRSSSGLVLGEIIGILDEAWGSTVGPDKELMVGLETGAVLVFSPHEKLGNPRRLQIHERRIRAVAISPDGVRMATGSSDRTVRVWAKTGGLWGFEQRLPTHLTWLRALQFLDGSRWLLLGAGDGRIRAWDCAKKRWGVEISAHSNDVQGLVAIPARGIVASISKDRTLAVSKFGSDKPDFRIVLPSTPWAIAADPNGTACYVGLDNGQLLAVSDTGEVAGIVGTREGAEIVGLAFCDTTGTLTAAARDGFLACYSLKGRTVYEKAEVHAHTGGCNSVTVVPGDAIALTTGTDGSVACWTLPGLKQLHRFQVSLPYSGMLLNPDGLPSSLAAEVELLGAVRTEA